MWENIGQGQLIDRFQKNPQSRAALKDAFQNVAQQFFNRNGMGVSRQPIPPPPPKTDYTPVVIAAVATVIAAMILTRK